MLASVLNTTTAIEVSVLIVRAFVRLRELLSTHKDLEKKILELESNYDEKFHLIFKATYSGLSPFSDSGDTRSLVVRF